MTTLAEERERLSKVIKPNDLRHSEFLQALAEEKFLDFNIRKRLRIIGIMLGYRPDINVPANFEFQIGATYPTMEGKLITIVGKTATKGYECVVGSDQIARYNRSTEDADVGRVTGSNGSDPRNLLPIRIVDAGPLERKPKGPLPYASGEEAEFISETPEQMKKAVKSVSIVQRAPPPAVGELARLQMAVNAPSKREENKELIRAAFNPSRHHDIFSPRPIFYSTPEKIWAIKPGHKAGSMTYGPGNILVHGEDGETLLVSYPDMPTQKFWIGKEWIVGRASKTSWYSNARS